MTHGEAGSDLPVGRGTIFCVPVPFGVVTTKTVPPAPAAGARWVVVMRRGGSWSRWRWLDRVSNRFDWEAADPASGLPMVPIALMALALPSIALHWVSYHARPRTDWDVLVFAGDAPDDHPASAQLLESCPTKEAACLRAEDLWTYLSAHEALPAE
jgi:hypothetical protein